MSAMWRRRRRSSHPPAPSDPARHRGLSDPAGSVGFVAARVAPHLLDVSSPVTVAPRRASSRASWPWPHASTAPAARDLAHELREDGIDEAGPVGVEGAAVCVGDPS